MEVEVVSEEVVTRISSKIDRYLQKQLLKKLFQKQMFLIVTIYSEVSYNFIKILEKYVRRSSYLVNLQTYSLLFY